MAVPYRRGPHRSRLAPAVTAALLVLSGCGAPTDRGTDQPSIGPRISQDAGTPDATTPPTPTPAIGVPGPGGWVRQPAFAALLPFDLQDVAAGGPGFVLVGYDHTLDAGSVWTSADGRAWTAVRSLQDSAHAVVSGVTLGGPGLVAVGWIDHDETKTAAVWTSRDALDWVRVPDAPAFASASMAKVAARGSRLVAVGEVAHPLPSDPEAQPADPGHAAAWVSDDGSAWHRVAEDPSFASSRMEWVAAGPLGFVASNGASVTDAVAWQSADGETWRAAGPPEVFHDAAIGAVVAGGSGWVAVGLTALSAGAWTSGDGLSWTPARGVDGSDDTQLVDVTPVDGGLVAVGITEVGAAVWRSTDGTAWTRLPDGPAFSGAGMVRIVRGSSGLLAVGTSFEVQDDNVNVIWLAPAP